MDKLSDFSALTDEQFVAKAAAMAPALRQRAPADEERRNVSADTIAEMREGGFFRLLQPKRFGGLERDLATAMRCSLEWSAADASAGWVGGLAVADQWLVAQFDPRCQEEVWGADPDAITFGSFALSGEAARADGGYRLTGSWGYASGCAHGDWALLGVPLPPTEEGGKPVPAFLMVPKADYAIEEVWNPMGLVATGSNNFVCEDAFVPDHRVLTLAQLAPGESPGCRFLESRLYAYPLLSMVAYCIAVPALGCLEGGLRAFTEQAGAWETRGSVVRGGAKVAGYQGVQIRVGAAAGALKAGKAMLFEQLEASRRRVMEEGAILTAAERLDNRLTQAYLVHLAVDGLDRLWGAVGGAGIDRGQAVQRHWRDVHAIAHHVSFNWDALMSMYGQHLLGLEPEGQY